MSLLMATPMDSTKSMHRTSMLRCSSSNIPITFQLLKILSSWKSRFRIYSPNPSKILTTKVKKKYHKSIQICIFIFQRPRPVRTQAARTILFFLRYNMKENHRKWIRESLINSLCNSNCCYTRHIFILMCIEAIQIFSWKYFKEHFFTHLLQLGGNYFHFNLTFLIQITIK